MTAEQIAELVLRYLDVFLRWPLAVFALGLTGMLLFRKPIFDFLSRITSAGGYGIQLSAASPQSQATAKKPGAPELANVVENQPPAQQQAIQYVQQHPTQVVEEYLRIFNAYRYERALNQIYGTQIDMLQYLSTKSAEGDAYTNLAVFYEEFRRRAGDSKYQMPDYVRFLHTLGFIEYFGDKPNFRVRITPAGLGFLSYVRGEYPLTYDKRPL
ncbi:MAG: hypothetical protein FJ266_15175 [Planctomycetes bacterium]|nr:hypothetical protein [Planctomycetota bacterium]